MSRTSGLYKDFPPEFAGTLNYHVDKNLSVGAFAAIIVLTYFAGFCVTGVLAIVVRRSSRGKPLGPGLLLIVFNLVSDITTQWVHILLLSFTGGDLAVFTPPGLAFAAWLIHIGGYMQINSVIAMFHLRRKVMQDVEQLVSDGVYNAKKYILIGTGAAIISQTVLIFGVTPKWLFSQKWFVSGDVDSDAERVLILTAISALGYDNAIHSILGFINFLLALVIPVCYNLYCLVPVLRLLRKMRARGICSAEMESMARLSITFYLIFIFFFMIQILLGILRQSLATNVTDGTGFTWAYINTLQVPNMVFNVVACYVFFPRFRAYFIALCYDVVGKSDLARKRELLSEKQIEEYNQTMMTTEGATTAATTTGTTGTTTQMTTATNTTTTNNTTTENTTV